MTDDPDDEFRERLQDLRLAYTNAADDDERRELIREIAAIGREHNSDTYDALKDQ